MNIMKPVDSCSICQSQVAELKDLYAMYNALPEPGIRGVLSAAIDEYNQHHKEQHPIHPDTLARKEMVRDFLKQFEGIQIFGAVDADEKPLVEEGLIFAYKNHLFAVGRQGVEDLGKFIPALSTVTLEQHCIEVWNECFGYEEEPINAK